MSTPSEHRVQAKHGSMDLSKGNTMAPAPPQGTQGITGKDVQHGATQRITQDGHCRQHRNPGVTEVSAATWLVSGQVKGACLGERSRQDGVGCEGWLGLGKGEGRRQLDLWDLSSLTRD